MVAVAARDGAAHSSVPAGVPSDIPSRTDAAVADDELLLLPLPLPPDVPSQSPV